MRIRASEAAAATGGRLVGPDVEITGAAFDSRSLRPGDLFVPIVAARDGHDFVADAIAAGAAAYLTSRPALATPQSSTVAAIEVADTGDALMALAGWARTRLPGTVVGITGSVGKTSTKDLVAAAVAADRRVAANERSFNNEQGLPVTIIGAAEDTEVVVLEMGMRGLGEIARLCAVARPDIGVVTGVAAAHTERVGGLAGVARAKGELVDALPATARRSSTPTTRPSRRWPRGRARPSSRSDAPRPPTCASSACNSTAWLDRGSSPVRRGGRSRSPSPSPGATWP